PNVGDSADETPRHRASPLAAAAPLLLPSVGAPSCRPSGDILAFSVSHLAPENSNPVRASVRRSAALVRRYADPLSWAPVRDGQDSDRFSSTSRITFCFSLIVWTSLVSVWIAVSVSWSASDRA